MEKTLSGTEPAASAKPDLRKALLGLVGFFLVFFTTHWLLLWLHPMGAHQFFWNLALGALGPDYGSFSGRARLGRALITLMCSKCHTSLANWFGLMNLTCPCPTPKRSHIAPLVTV
jgi:hypothetical protein